MHASCTLQPAAATGSLTSTLRAEEDTTPAAPLAATIDPTEAQAAADQAGPSRPPGTAPADEVEDDMDDEAPEAEDDDSKGLSERLARLRQALTLPDCISRQE